MIERRMGRWTKGGDTEHAECVSGCRPLREPDQQQRSLKVTAHEARVLFITSSDDVRDLNALILKHAHERKGNGTGADN